MVKVSWFVFVEMFVVTGTIGLSSTRLGNVPRWTERVSECTFVEIDKRRRRRRPNKVQNDHRAAWKCVLVCVRLPVVGWQ